MIYKSKDIRWAKIRLLFSSSGWKRAKYLKKNKIFLKWVIIAIIIQGIFLQNHFLLNYIMMCG